MSEKLPSTSRATIFSSLWSQVRAVLDLVLDFSFKRMVTPRLIRVIYALSLVAALLYALSWMFGGDGEGVTSRFFRFVTGPLAFFAYLLVARVVTELVLAVFKIAENTETLTERSDKK